MIEVTSGSTDRKVTFTALDSSGQRLPGLTSFTVYRSRNGGALTAMTTPTVAELSGVNAPGEYALTIDEDTTIADGHDNEELLLVVSAATMQTVSIRVLLTRAKLTEGRTGSVKAGGFIDASVEAIINNVEAPNGLAQMATQYLNDERLNARVVAADSAGQTAIQTAAAAAITAYDPPTRTEATNDKDAVLAAVAAVEDAVAAIESAVSVPFVPNPRQVWKMRRLPTHVGSAYPITKQPGEALRVYADFGAVLGAGESIGAVETIAVTEQGSAGVTIVSGSVQRSGALVSAVVSGGAAGVDTKLQFAVQTTTGAPLIADGALRLRD